MSKPPSMTKPKAEGGRFRIRTLFLASAALLVLLSGGVAVMVVRATESTNVYANQAALSERIISYAFEQNNFALEYADRHEERPKRQWYLQYGLLTEALHDPALSIGPSGALLPQLLEDASALKDTFDKLVSQTELSIPNQAAEDQLSGDLVVRSRSLIVSAHALAQRAYVSRTETRAETDRIIFQLLASLVAVICLIGFVLYRRIIGSLDRLQKGVRIIGRGNLDYRVGGDGGGDEISQLSAAFDDMTTKLRRSYATLEDKVTERTRELSELNRKNATLLQSIGDGVVAIDRRWDVILLNGAAERLTGWTSEEALGRPFRDVIRFVRGKDRTENISFIEQVMLHGKGMHMDDDTLLIDRSGKAVPVSDSAAPVFDPLSGKVSGAIIVFRDASAERELKEKGEQIAKLKDDFMFRTIHDLRSPANGIRMALEMHAEEEERRHVPDDLKKGFSMIQDASNRMAKLIEDLLEIARGEKTEVILAKTPLKLGPILDSVVAQLAPAAKAKGVEIKVTSAKGVPKVVGDADALKEVFDNLINNAVKYGKDVGGRVAVRVEPEEGKVLVTVLDNGIGMSSADLGKLFTPYFRAGGNDIPGTGLGLYIVKKLVEKMGGTVEVDSTFGEGTRFRVRLPAQTG